MQRLSHALKGSALTLCARPLSAAAARLESACMAAKRGGAYAQVFADTMGDELEGMIELLSDTMDAVRRMLESGEAI